MALWPEDPQTQIKIMFITLPAHK